MRRRSPRCFCAIRSARRPCLSHSAAITPQQLSAAAFSRRGASAVTNWRSVASICGSRGFRSCSSYGERLTEGVEGRCYQCRAVRGNRQDSLRPRKKLGGRSFTPMARPGGHSISPRIALGRRSHIIRSLPGKAQPPLGGVRGETESANDTGRGCDTEDSAAPLSLFDGGRHPRDGTAEAHRGRKERHHQRIPLSRTLSGSAGHAWRSDYRVHGANRWTLAAHGSSRSRKQAALLRGSRRRAISQAGGARRPIEDRDECAFVARGLLQAGRQSNGGWKTCRRSDADVQDGGPRRDDEGPRTREMTMREIHPQALVAASAKLGDGVKIGAYAVVGEAVELCDGCVCHAHATVGGRTKFGSTNVFYSFSAIAGDRQCSTFRGWRPEF